MKMHPLVLLITKLKGEELCHAFSPISFIDSLKSRRIVTDYLSSSYRILAYTLYWVVVAWIMGVELVHILLPCTRVKGVGRGRKIL